MRVLWRGFLRLFFRLLYRECSWAYDWVASAVSLGRWEAWGRTTLAYLHSEPVLELGHGPGHLLVTLTRRGSRVAGIDVSGTMGRRARRRLEEAGLGARLVRARAQALPFPSSQFGSVVSTFPTDFIFHPRTLHEVRRVLRPAGRLVVALGTQFEGPGLRSRFLTWLYRATGQGEPAVDPIVQWLERAGFSMKIVREDVGGSSVLLLLADRV